MATATNRDGGQENRGDTQKFGVPRKVPDRNSGIFAGGRMTHEPENENFHVRLSGNPAILGFRQSFRPETLRPHLSMSLPCFRIRIDLITAVAERAKPIK